MLHFLSNIEPKVAILAFFSILPWGFFLVALHPTKLQRKIVISFIALLLGVLSTELILRAHPIIWPEIDFKPKKNATILTQTVYISFIQAGMMEETFKELFILLFGLIAAFRYSSKEWQKEIVLIGGFVALGFSLIENYHYIGKDSSKVYTMFIGRTIFSSNIHLLINLCFSLFLLKSNFQTQFRDKLIIIFYGYFLAVMQHGVVDFFLLPGSRFGNWLSTAMFVGIWVWVVRDLRTYVFRK